MGASPWGFKSLYPHQASEQVTRLRSLRQALEYLEQHRAARFRYGRPSSAWLTRVDRLAKALGHPEQAVRAVHVAGTSGKGSTTSYIAALLRVHGYRVGHTISPHLHDVRERIQLNGQPIGRSEFLDCLSIVATAADTLERDGYDPSTSFELLTATAWVAFKRAGVRYAVFETGLGGGTDATNVRTLLPKVCVITPIGEDHLPTLGRTLTDIARHKTAIIRHGDIAYTVPGQPAAVRQALIRRCKLTKSPLVVAADPVEVAVESNALTTRFTWQGERFRLEISGVHQTKNATLALEVVQAIAKRDGFSFDRVKAMMALARTVLPGRSEWQQRGLVRVLFDGAHNAPKVLALAETVRILKRSAHVEVLFAVKRRKAFRDMLAILSGLGCPISLTTIPGGLSCQELTAVLRSLGGEVVSANTDPVVAFRAALARQPDVLVVTGSLKLVALLRR